jgi:hypothetical protein
MKPPGTFNEIECRNPLADGLESHREGGSRSKVGFAGFALRRKEDRSSALTLSYGGAAPETKGLPS